MLNIRVHVAWDSDSDRYHLGNGAKWVNVLELSASLEKSL